MEKLQGPDTKKLYATRKFHVPNPDMLRLMDLPCH